MRASHILTLALMTVLPCSGASELQWTEDAAFSVVRMESTWVSSSDSGSYSVDGVLLTRGEGPADTLFWMAPLPAEVLHSLEVAGASEARHLELIAAGASWISGRMRIRLVSEDGSESLFSALRTWLLDGTELDLDMVVQRDSLFDSLIRDSLGMPAEGNIDSWLWRRGFWFDPQSFVLEIGEDSLPFLVLGMPSSEGSDTILTVTLEVELLNTASSSMLD